jgi:recombination protein RecA
LHLALKGLRAPGIIEVFGEASSGKTSLCLEFVAAVQKAGGLVGWLNVEKEFDHRYAKARGVDSASLLLATPGCGEAAWETIHGLCVELDLLVVDSAAMLLPLASLETSTQEGQPGHYDRMMAHGLNLLQARSKAAVVFTNQMRQNKTAGGPALGIIADQRLELLPGPPVKQRAETIGRHIRVVVHKNVLQQPGTERTWRLLYPEALQCSLERKASS